MKLVNSEVFFDYLADKRIQVSATETDKGNSLVWKTCDSVEVAEITGYNAYKKSYHLNFDFLKNVLTKADFTKLCVDAGLPVNFPDHTIGTYLTQYVTYSDGSVYDKEQNKVVN